jgi:hypothetical protein
MRRELKRSRDPSEDLKEFVGLLNHAEVRDPFVTCSRDSDRPDGREGSSPL